MVGDDHRQTGSTGETDNGVSRRGLLRSTAGIAAATAGAGALASGVAAQTSSGSCSGDDAWLSAPQGYPVLDLRGSTPQRVGDWPDDPDTVSFFAHGLGGDSNEGWKRQAYTFESAARDNGWDPTMIALLYDTGNQVDPTTGVQSAQAAGERFASWLREYDGENDVSTYSAFSHSLGGHVLGSLLDALGGDVTIDNVATMGPAIPASSVCEGSGQYATGISQSAGAFHNYRSSNDSVICGVYSAPIIGEGNPGLGCEAPGCGLGGSTPANFYDHDVSDQVGSHCDYLKADVGCVPDVIADLGLDGGTTGATGGSGGSSGGLWGTGGSSGSSGDSGGLWGSGGSSGGDSGGSGGLWGSGGSSGGGSGGLWGSGGSSGGSSGGLWGSDGSSGDSSGGWF